MGWQNTKWRSIMGYMAFFISWVHSERVADGHVAQAFAVAQEHMSVFSAQGGSMHGRHRQGEDY